MKDEIYVGNLVSPEELSHSAKGSKWKDHKYIKKIGDRYYYTQEELAKAAKKAGKAIGDAAYDAQFELEWQAGRAADAVKDAVDTVGYNVNKATGLDLRKEYNRNKSNEQHHREEAAYFQRKADQANAATVRAYGLFDPKKESTKGILKSYHDDISRQVEGQRYHLKRAGEYQDRANAYKRRYDKTPAGKLENSVNKGIKTLSGLFERRKKLKKKKK